MERIFDSLDTAIATVRRSPTIRLIGVGILVLILQIPVMMIGGLVAEREARRTAAVADVSSKWGNTQTIVGPAIVLPYTHHLVEVLGAGQQVSRSESRFAVFLPDRLHIAATVDADSRRRGIFSI